MITIKELVSVTDLYNLLIFCQFYLTQKEMSVTKQHIFPPVWKIQQKALQRVLRNKSKLIIHVHGKSTGRNKNKCQ